MGLFFTGIVIFFGLHLFSVFRSREEGRDIREQWGRVKYVGTYSVASLIGLGLMFWGFFLMPHEPPVYLGPRIFYQKPWLIMFPALVLLASTYTPMGYIKRFVQHPMMLGVLVLSVFYVLKGGQMKWILLCVFFAVYALLSLLMSYRRGTELKEKQPKVSGDVIAIAIGIILTCLFGIPFNLV